MLRRGQASPLRDEDPQPDGAADERRAVQERRPLPFFSACAALLAVAGLAFGAEVVLEYLHTHLVPRLPTAVLATGLMLLASLSLACGLILDSVARGRREMKRLAYLAVGAQARPGGGA